MGEHAPDGDPDEEESATAPSDDSPPENGDAAGRDDDGQDPPADADAGDDQESRDEDTDANGSDADASGPDEDAGAGEGDHSDAAEENRPGMFQYDTSHDPLPSAEEWLEEHDGEENAPGRRVDDLEPTDADDEASSDATDEEGAPSDAAEWEDSDEDPSLHDVVTPGGPTPPGGEPDLDETATDDTVDGSSNAEASDDESADDPTDQFDTYPKESEESTASTSVSTSDPGQNAPAGMGQPTPAGGGSSSGGTSSGGGGFPDFEGDMAPDDQEQPLTEHVEEMTYRFLAVVLVMGGVAAIALLWSDDMINFLWYSFLGPDNGTCPGPNCPLQWRPHVYHPLSLLLARLKIAMLVGFVAGLPIAVYQAYRFMRPGLYPHERRYYLAAVPTSLVLAISGVAFAYFVVLPSLFIYFSAYSTQAAELAFALSDTFNLMVMMLGFFAVIFQIPLLVMLAIMMGVTTRRWLEQRRIYFWTGFGGVAFFFSPDPTGMAPLIVALTMIALFEGTLLLLRWTERSVALVSAETMTNNRPYAWFLALFAGYVVSSLPVPEGYFDQLPPVFVETLANYGYVGFTPAIIAGGIILAFEILGWIARRVGAGQGVRQGLRVRLAFIRARPFVWFLALVAGYMGSPDPILLDVFRDVAYPPLVAAGVAVGLVVLWEAVRLVLSYVRPE